jgi:hypothetical protein
MLKVPLLQVRTEHWNYGTLQGRLVTILDAGAGTSLQTCTNINTSLTCVCVVFSRCLCVKDAKMLVQVSRLVPAKAKLTDPAEPWNP